MAEMKYPEFRQKLIDLVREVVTQLPERRRAVETLAQQLGTEGENGNVMRLLTEFRHKVSAKGLKEQIENLAMDADYATSHGCTQKEFEQWKYNRDLTKAIEEAIGEEI